MSNRDAIFPASRHALYDLHKYSPAIRAGDLVFISGQVGSRDDGSPEPVFEDQVRRAFANLKAVLAAAGGSFDDVIDVDRAVEGDLRLLHVIGNAGGGMAEMAENLPVPQELDDRILAIIEIDGVVDMAINVDVSHRDPEGC